MGLDINPADPQSCCSGIQPSQARTFYGHHRRKDGTVFPIEARLNSCEIRGQRLILALVRDITERRQAEAAVQHRLELEERLSRVAANVPGMIYTLRQRPDGSLSFPYVGPAAEEIFGIRAEELTKNVESGFKMVHPKDLDQIMNSIPQSGRDLSTWHSEFRIRHPLKGELWVEGRSMPQREPDGSILWYGFLHDITERKRAEEVQARLATAVEQAAEVIVITDAEGTILYVNPAFEKVTGYAAAEALGQNPRILKSGRHDADFYRRMWERMLEEGVWTGRVTNKRKNGSLYQEEMTISPMRDAAGKVVNYVAVKRDVTREVELESNCARRRKWRRLDSWRAGSRMTSTTSSPSFRATPACC